VEYHHSYYFYEPPSLTNIHLGVERESKFALLMAEKQSRTVAVRTNFILPTDTVRL